MKSFAVLIILCAACCMVKAGITCKEEAGKQSKSWFMGNLVKVNFFEAFQICQVMNMRLASISSPEDQLAISELIWKSRPRGGTVDSYWTSGTDLGSEGRFIWLSTGQPIVFTNWAKGQPDNFKHGDEYENCLEIWSIDSGLTYNWNDRVCSGKNFFICEY